MHLQSDNMLAALIRSLKMFQSLFSYAVSEWNFVIMIFVSVIDCIW